MNKIDKIKQKIEKLREQKQEIIQLEESYIKMIQDNCNHPLYMRMSSSKKKDPNTLTIRCLDCEKEVVVTSLNLPIFEDGTVRVIDWNNTNLKKELRFKIAQDEYKRFTLENHKDDKTKDEIAKTFKKQMVGSCRKKV